MTTTTFCTTLLFAAILVAQEPGAPALACNTKAIPAALKPRYLELTTQLRKAVRDIKGLPDGYALKLDGMSIRLTDAAEWMSLERLCCPFLTLELSASGRGGDWTLKLTGPEGVKAILDAEFKQ